MTDVCGLTSEINKGYIRLMEFILYLYWGLVSYIKVTYYEIIFGCIPKSPKYAVTSS
jgi:hypothetical protein